MPKTSIKKSVAVTQKQPFTQKQVELITRTVAKGANMDELGLFFNVAKRAGLDPFMKQIHLIPRSVKQGDKYVTVRSVQVGVDGYLSIAERTKQLAGIDDAIFDDGYHYEPGKEPKNPSKASVTVFRLVKGDRVPFTASARWKEYYPGAKMGFMWDKMPYGQLAKCALALALRKAFPSDLSGIYTNEEMEQAGSPVVEINEQAKSEPMQGEVVQEVEKKVEDDKPEFFCHDCASILTKAENDFSSKLYGKPLCRECQKNATKII